ncbi:hypothetical protein PMAYCL1PPCAC_20891, partial [Pristionchus mayeri]
KLNYSGSVLCDERTTLCIRTRNEKFEMASCASSTPLECKEKHNNKCPPLPKDGPHVCCCKEDNCNKGAA